MRKVELLPTRDCEAGYGPVSLSLNIYVCLFLTLSFQTSHLGIRDTYISSIKAEWQEFAATSWIGFRISLSRFFHCMVMWWWDFQNRHERLHACDPNTSMVHACKWGKHDILNDQNELKCMPVLNFDTSALCGKGSSDHYRITMGYVCLVMLAFCSAYLARSESDL